jgi:hypothetical protein
MRCGRARSSPGTPMAGSPRPEHCSELGRELAPRARRRPGALRARSWPGAGRAADAGTVGAIGPGPLLRRIPGILPQNRRRAGIRGAGSVASLSHVDDASAHPRRAQPAHPAQTRKNGIGCTDARLLVRGGAGLPRHRCSAISASLGDRPPGAPGEGRAGLAVRQSEVHVPPARRQHHRTRCVEPRPEAHAVVPLLPGAAATPHRRGRARQRASPCVDEVRQRFVLCRHERKDGRDQIVWRNPTREEAESFFRASRAGIQHIGEILVDKGLW